MSAPAPSQGLPPIPPNVGAITGSQLTGAMMNCCLFGVLAVQVYIYRLSFPNDNKYIKMLVYFVFVFETVQTILNAVDIFKWFSDGFGNLINFANPRMAPVYTPIMGSVMALIVQVFFCYRIWIIRRSSWWWCILVGSISLLQAIAGFVDGVKSDTEHDVAKRFDEIVLVYIWLIGSAVADTLIAATMAVLLMGNKLGQHHQINDVVARIVRLTVETNAISAAIAIISLVLYLALPGTTYFVCPTFIIGKVYANTLLVTFNNRISLHKSLSLGSPSHTSSYSNRVSTQPPQHVPFSAGLSFNEPREVSVTIRSQSHTFVDSEIGLHGLDADSGQKSSPL